MTEQMAIEELKALRKDDKRVYAEEYEALEVAIQALEEIQQYRAIGTVENLQALKEKSVAKKPIEQGTDDKTIYKCSCGNVLMEKYSDGLICGFITDYCKVCGRKLLRADVDWE